MLKRTYQHTYKCDFTVNHIFYIFYMLSHHAKSKVLWRHKVELIIALSKIVLLDINTYQIEGNVTRLRSKLSQNS